MELLHEIDPDLLQKAADIAINRYPNLRVRLRRGVFWNFLEKNDKAGICAPKMVDSNQNLVRRSSWKIRKPAIDMVNSTRLTEVLFWWLLRKGEYEHLPGERQVKDSIDISKFVAITVGMESRFDRQKVAKTIKNMLNYLGIYTIPITDTEGEILEPIKSIEKDEEWER